MITRPLEAHEIVPRLWMGSRPEPGPALATMGFDVLALCAMEYQPTTEWYPGIVIGRIRLDDAELSAGQALQAFQLAAQLAKMIKMKKRVLVTCAQGRNRSGLITALTMVALTGCSGFEACHAVRVRRQSPFGPALMNHHYMTAICEIPAAQVRGVLTQQAAQEARLAG